MIQDIYKNTVNQTPESDGSPSQRAVLPSHDYQFILCNLRTDKRSGKQERLNQLD